MKRVKINSSTKIIVSIGITPSMAKALKSLQKKEKYKNRHQQILGVLVNYLNNAGYTKLNITIEED